MQPEIPTRPAAHELLSVTFRERIPPRDLTDVLLMFPLTVWAVVMFQLLPMLVALACFQAAGLRGDKPFVLALLVGLAVLIDVGLLISFLAVRSMTVDRDGLFCRRYAGPSKRILWEDLTSIRPARRSEVFRRVWLWPGIPPRGSVMCASTRGQHRLEWNGGHYYFAPADEHGFLDALARHRPDLFGQAIATSTHRLRDAAPSRSDGQAASEFSESV